MKKITTAVTFLGSVLCAGPAGASDLPMPSGDAAATHETASAAYMDTRDIIFYALSMVGINYRWGGSSPQTGFDCSGLVGHVFRQIAGLVLPRDSYAMARIGRPVTLEDLRPGDLVFFNTMRRPFSHVGIYLGDKRFVHAPSAGKSVHVVDMTEPYWSARFNGARRIGL
ncbi:MAG: peptidoglycan endopeptidase [Betaproteobacteria bacterium]|nr:MAG: peptidoglycan endopeptidase [Betaproteobacteria bacterium]